MTLLALQIEAACLMEAAARKPGNVHPGASFHDLRFGDFVNAAAAAAPILAEARTLGVGRAVLDAVRATRAACGTNVNLGICLLLAPLAAVHPEQPLEQGLGDVLRGTTVEDAELVYEAIRCAHPGGLGTAPEQDVAGRPTVTLREAMLLAAERDAIARQWATDFRDVRRLTSRVLIPVYTSCETHQLPRCVMDGRDVASWEAAVLATQLEALRRGDTLVRRKCGALVERRLQRRAQAAQALGGWWTTAGRARLARLNQWLRSDGHRRNPGATADLLAACLFWALRCGALPLPDRDALLQNAATFSEERPR